MTDIPKTKYGVAIALFRGSNIFLSKRMWNQLHYAGAWQIVYGFTNTDYERYADAAKRVLKEETGLDITIDRFCYIKSMMVGNEFYYTYFVHLKDGEILNDPDAEQSKLRSGYVSFPLERAVNMKLVPCLEKMLRTALKALEKSILTKAPPSPVEDRNAWSCMCDYD